MSRAGEKKGAASKLGRRVRKGGMETIKSDNRMAAAAAAAADEWLAATIAPSSDNLIIGVHGNYTTMLMQAA